MSSKDSLEKAMNQQRNEVNLNSNVVNFLVLLSILVVASIATSTGSIVLSEKALDEEIPVKTQNGSATGVRVDRINDEYILSVNYAGNGRASQGNTATGADSANLAGVDNTVDGQQSVNIAGVDNTISTGSDYSVTSGGVSNQIYNDMCFVAGGHNNSASGTSSAIVGGHSNTVKSYNSCVIGGKENFCKVDNTFVAGGFGNGVSGELFTTENSVVLGGFNNLINGMVSTDVCVNSAIMGGYSNGISGTDSSGSAIAGGLSCSVTGTQSYKSFIGGGQENKITGTYSALSSITGGWENEISGTESYQSFIGGGNKNTIAGTTAINSAIAGGVSNQVYSDMCFVAGGHNNSASGSSSAVVGGDSNQINGSGTATHSAIIGGEQNKIEGSLSKQSFIGGGFLNSVSGFVTRGSGIIGGYQNKIEGTQSYQSFIGGGSENKILGSDSVDSGIIGGNEGRINSKFTFIGGGHGLSTQEGTSWENSALFGEYNTHATYPWDQSGTQTLQGSGHRLVVGGGTGDLSRKTAFSVDNVGNIYVGTQAGASIYMRTGATSYEAKAFTIEHPTEGDRWLRHGCLEGPEGGVYYRGRGVAPTIIKLPDYAPKIASDFTLQVTPIGEPRVMSASEVTPEGSFNVYGEGPFHWTATGERVSMNPEPLKSEILIRSMGPYSWALH